MHNEAQTIRERHIIRQAKLVVLKSINSRSDTIQQHYNAAIDAFADVLNFTTKPDHKRFLTADVNINLSILVIHVAALVALLDVNQIATERQDQVMGRLLEHEDRYWQRTAQAYGLSWLTRAARRQSVAELCLTGSRTVRETAKLLDNIPDLAGTDDAMRRTVARWLQSLYPGASEDQLSPLRPHLLSERLVVQEMANDSEFAAAALRGMSYDVTQNALIVLGFASYKDSRAARFALNVLEQDPERMILPAICAAVETGLPLDDAISKHIQLLHMDATRLADISARIPLTPGSLEQTATTVREKLIAVAKPWLRQTTKRTTDQAELERRQRVLLELSRVNEGYQHKQGNFAPNLREDLLKALRRQTNALTYIGQLEAAAVVTKKIGQIEGRKPVN
jgi:hypothetical protein